MHKNLRILLPDLQDVDVKVNFSADVFAVVVRLCREFGQLLFFFSSTVRQYRIRIERGILITCLFIVFCMKYSKAKLAAPLFLLPI